MQANAALIVEAVNNYEAVKAERDFLKGQVEFHVARDKAPHKELQRELMQVCTERDHLSTLLSTVKVQLKAYYESHQDLMNSPHKYGDGLCHCEPCEAYRKGGAK